MILCIEIDSNSCSHYVNFKTICQLFINMSISNNNIRNSNVELLRIFLMLGILIWHIIIHGGGYKNIGQASYVLDGNLAIVTLLCSFLAPCTYCFMFISGWYGIKFSLRRFLYFVFIGLFCFWISILINYSLYGVFSIKGALRHLFPISSNVWWFFTSYVFVFLVSPYINIGFEYLSKSLTRCIVIIMTIIEIASFPNNGSSFYGLLYVYILARFLRMENITI